MLLIKITDGGLNVALLFKLRFFGDDVDGTARLALPIKGRAWPFHYFNSLNVNRTSIAAVATYVKAVYQIPRRIVFIARKATNSKAIEHTARVVLPYDSRRKIQCIDEACDPFIC